MDDFVFGEPQAAQPPAEDVQGPKVKVKGAPKKIELKKLRRGLKLRLTPDEAASYQVTLLGSARSVQIARKRNNVILAEKRLGRADGERELKLKPARKLLKQAPNRFKLQLRVEATDGAGNSATVRKSIRVSS